MSRRWPILLAPVLGLAPSNAGAQGKPDGAAVLRLLGARAPAVFSPVTGQMGALVTLPGGVSAASLGLEDAAPGIGRLRGSAPKLLAFADAHPDLAIEVSPPLHPLLDSASYWVRAGVARQNYGVDGTGTLVGVADTGIDVTHPDFLDAAGHTRVAWLLDLSLKPAGRYPDLEKKYGILDDNGNPIAGAVLDASMIDEVLAQAGSTKPQDEVGHGTHVTSIAAGNGGGPNKPYTGIAPSAGILFARVTGQGSQSISNDDLLRAVGFLFDRADSMGRPLVVNLSLGSDFGPHDGTMDWEQTLASYVGPAHPGHALVVAAGNSGSIVDTPIHQNVFVTPGTRLRVPLTEPTNLSGGAQVWVTMHAGAQINVGLDGPDGEWIAPVAPGQQGGKTASVYKAGVVNGSSVSGSPVPQGSNGAVVIWQGTVPAGVYAVTLEGQGTVDLYVEGIGDLAGSISFSSGIREGTVNLPATSPALIAVGCTVNKSSWISIDKGAVGLSEPLLDATGMMPDPSGAMRPINSGEMCWFSSAGPTVTGVPKPEIAAPGAIVVAAMSGQALPGSSGSIFTNPSCPGATAGAPPDPKCLQVDAHDAVAVGTSMSAPMVAGAVALLLERDPTLTQDEIVPLLQAGAHPFAQNHCSGNQRLTGQCSPLTPDEAAPFQDQSGPGELDVVGTLDALEQLASAATQGPLLPDKGTSWLTLSSDYASADGSTPVTGIVELRTADGGHRADMFDVSRLQPYVVVAGSAVEPPALVRRAPGLWTMAVAIPPGLGGEALTLGITFDGADVVAPRTIPIGADAWSASYAPALKGGCDITPAGNGGGGAAGAGLLGAVALARARRRRGAG
jgi:subtilisin family serine protease